jgi:hypothetical protein
MLALSPKSRLSPKTIHALAKYQAEIDDCLRYEEMVRKAAAIWDDRKRNSPFGQVKKYLAGMCSGARRCCYCEDSVGDEIEHIHPKSFFPEMTFDPTNYLYSCGGCNISKGNRWAIFQFEDNKLQVIHYVRGAGNPVQEPPRGQAVFINPRKEKPLAFLRLDLRPIEGKLYFFELEEGDADELTVLRTNYTIETLGLNARGDIAEGRYEAYGDYKARVGAYIHGVENGVPSSELAVMIVGIQRKRHPTVWKEILRYHEEGKLKTIDSEFDAYLNAMPQAFAW